MTTTFATVLKRLREQRGLSQEALARQCDGLSNRTISALEQGVSDPRWKTVCKLADALGVGTDKFRK